MANSIIQQVFVVCYASASTEEQRNVIRYLVAEEIGFREVHQRMKAMYGEYALSLTFMQDWLKHFRDGIW